MPPEPKTRVGPSEPQKTVAVKKVASPLQMKCLERWGSGGRVSRRWKDGVEGAESDALGLVDLADLLERHLVVERGSAWEGEREEEGGDVLGS